METPGKNYEISGKININELLDKLLNKIFKEFRLNYFELNFYRVFCGT